VSLIFRGLDQGIDFTGGRTFVVRFDKNVQTSEIRNSLTAQFGGNPPEVKTFGPNNQVKITTKFMIEESGVEVDSVLQHKLYDGVKSFYDKKDLAFNDFSADVSNKGKLLGVLSSQKVGPTIAADIRNRAVLAVIFSLIGIFIYVAIRFKKWQYGFAGLVSLFHDAFIVIGLYSLFYSIMPFGMEADQGFIAAILTIIGYSINDTVIIFDRIREYVHLHPKRDYKLNVNEALNHTLSRTVNTVGTVIVVLVAMFFFGGETIRGFCFALLFGVIFGTYSSVLVATPVAYDLMARKLKKDANLKTIK
jgi:SecD/SecF fusion protein